MRKRKQIVGVFVLIFLIMINFDVVQAIAPPRLDETDLGTLDTEQATITITNVQEEDELSVYKILDIYKNSINNEINYRYTAAFYTFLEVGGAFSKDYSHLTEEEYLKLTSGEITSGSTQTSSTLDVLVSDYAAYINKNKISGATMNLSGGTASLTTDTGSYLVLGRSNQRLYAVMVGNLDYKEVNGEWVKQNSTIVAKTSEPTVDVWINKIGQDKESVSIGEEYTYLIETSLPLYPTNGAKNPAVGIIFGNGIAFQGLDDFSIELSDTQLIVKDKKFENDVYSATIVNNSGDTIGLIKTKNRDGGVMQMNINFDSSLVTSKKIKISFKAKLKETVELCRKRELLNVELNTLTSSYPSNVLSVQQFTYHSYDSWSMSDRDGVSLIKNAYAFTYKMQINKHVLGDPIKKLGGAVFEIYSDSALTKKVGTVTTDDDGFAEFSGLGEGKYYLKEVTAPTGYSLLKLPTEIEIKYDESLIDSETGEYCGPVVDISNTKISALPITGGMGTIIFTLVGILLIGNAVLGITYYKKKNRGLV